MGKEAASSQYEAQKGSSTLVDLFLTWPSHPLTLWSISGVLEGNGFDALHGAPERFGSHLPRQPRVDSPLANCTNGRTKNAPVCPQVLRRADRGKGRGVSRLVLRVQGDIGRVMQFGPELRVLAERGQTFSCIVVVPSDERKKIAAMILEELHWILPPPQNGPVGFRPD